MIAPAPRRRFTFRDYLDLEEASNIKHEYWAGEIYAMAGGTPAHAALSTAAGAEILGQLAGGDRRVFSSDLRVRVRATGLATYPDVTVVCGALETDPESASTVTNPTVIVEVLSPSTESYDRGEKLEHYRRIESLRECVLIAHDRRRIEVWRRSGDGPEWSQVVVEEGRWSSARSAADFGWKSSIGAPGCSGRHTVVTRPPPPRRRAPASIGLRGRGPARVARSVCDPSSGAALDVHQGGTDDRSRPRGAGAVHRQLRP